MILLNGLWKIVVKRLGMKKIKFCDFECKYAQFTKTKYLDGSGSCRTFQVVWCKKLKKYVLKNDVCKVK